MLKKGITVDVYQKPISQEDYEGKAELRKFISGTATKRFERWKVSFTGPYGTLFERMIKTNQED